MFFASDNSGPVHPRILAALTEANDGRVMGYGGDGLTERATALLRDAFEAPEAEVALVPTGTAANAIALASLTQPWQRIYCAESAHIIHDEMGAVPFYTGGAELCPLSAPAGKIDPDALSHAIGTTPVERRGPLSLAQVTEAGTVYSLETLRALTAIAADAGLPVHMDGARFANAVVALNCSAAEMTTRAGVTAVSFGGTKNGAMGVEAVVVLEPSRAPHLTLLRQRAGHTFSKHRYLAAQIVAMLEGDLWREMATAANAAAARLGAGLSNHSEITLEDPVDANEVFVRMPAGLHRGLHSAGVVHALWSGEADGPDDNPVICRFVCDWSATPAEIDAALGVLERL